MGLYSIGKGIYDASGALTVSPGPGMKIRDLPPQKLIVENGHNRNFRGHVKVTIS